MALSDYADSRVYYVHFQRGFKKRGRPINIYWTDFLNAFMLYCSS